MRCWVVRMGCCRYRSIRNLIKNVFEIEFWSFGAWTTSFRRWPNYLALCLFSHNTHTHAELIRTRQEPFQSSVFGVHDPHEENRKQKILLNAQTKTTMEFCLSLEFRLDEMTISLHVPVRFGTNKNFPLNFFSLFCSCHFRMRKHFLAGTFYYYVSNNGQKNSEVSITCKVEIVFIRFCLRRSKEEIVNIILIWLLLFAFNNFFHESIFCCCCHMLVLA